MQRAPSLRLIVAAGLAFASACGGGGKGNGGNEPPPPDTCSNVPDWLRVTDAWTADPHYCVYAWAMNIPASRGLVVTPSNDILVANHSEIRSLHDTDGDGYSDQVQFALHLGLNHGLTMTPTHVYASTSTEVYRWPYTYGARVASGPEELVVGGIPDGGHSSRSLVIDAENRLYVSIGSAGNVDTLADLNTPS